MMNDLKNDRPRCGRCIYWKDMRCTNKASRMYGFEMFQRADGICILWKYSGDFFDEEEDE